MDDEYDDRKIHGIERYKNKKLNSTTGANVADHHGMGNRDRENRRRSI